MDIYDVGTVQHYSMWLTSKTNHNSNMKNEQILYYDAIYYVRRLWFNKNHEFERRNKTFGRRFIKCVYKDQIFVLALLGSPLHNTS